MDQPKQEKKVTLKETRAKRPRDSHTKQDKISDKKNGPFSRIRPTHLKYVYIHSLKAFEDLKFMLCCII